MSVYTTADEKKEKAKEHIAEAKRLLASIVIDKCWGHEEYSRDYILTLQMALIDLMKMEDSL